MGFFKDFKDDFSQAVNELMPADDNLETSTNEDDVEVNTLEGEAVQQDTLRRGFLHQYCHKQGHRTCADRKHIFMVLVLTEVLLYVRIH